MTAVLSALTEDSLRVSSQLHNGYPLDIAMAEVDMGSEQVNELCRIIVKFDYQGVIRIRQLHRHFDLSEGQILLEEKTEGVYRTAPTPIRDIDLAHISGQVFSEKQGVLFPTEFRYGSSSLKLDAAFLAEFARALVKNKLDADLGIEVAQDAKRRPMIEFSDESGSILCDAADVCLKQGETMRCTGWRVTDGGVVDANGEVRCVFMNGAHQKNPKQSLEKYC
jgi:hypothetical protein